MHADVSRAAENELLAKVSRLEQQCKVSLSDTEAFLRRRSSSAVDWCVSLVMLPSFPATGAKSCR